MIPSFITGPEASVTRVIGMQPVLYLFPALALVAGHQKAVSSGLIRQPLGLVLLASEPNDFDQVFQESIFRHTRGHALFTVELLRGFQESGTIVRDARGRWVTKSEMTITSLRNNFV